MLAAVLMLCAALPCFSASVSAAPDPEDAAGSEVSDVSDAPEWTERSEADVFARMKIAAENENLALWIWDTDQLDEDADEKPEDLFALVNKRSGCVWWSSPINAQGDRIATPVLRNRLASAMVLTDAKINERTRTDFNSGDTNRTGITIEPVENGVRVSYFFRKCGIRLPVSYLLHDDYLEVRADTAQITEKHGPDDEAPQLAQALAVLNAFGAADSRKSGYFVIPDGSGAIIRFNNQKYAANPYSQMIYGSDITAVPKIKAPVTESIPLPMFGICKGENAMLAVADAGAENCLLCADVSGSGQSNTEYNHCYFKFLLRSSDQFNLGNEQIDVYEKDLPAQTISVRYYPLTASDAVNADGSAELDYTDIAARYRQYLLEDQQVPVKAQPDTSVMQIDLYGGCMKQRNVLGFPVFLKTAATTFSDMQQITARLLDAGAGNMQIALHRWTNAGISGKVDCKAKPARILGGKDGFRQLTDYFGQNSIAWYPVAENTAFYSGGGYWALTDTAVRVSGSFARIVDFEPAFGVPYGKKKTMSLLSPAAFPSLYQELAANSRKRGLQSISIGAMSSALYGDYGKRSAVSRGEAAQSVAESLKQLQKEVGPVLSADPNAYLLPYTDTISDLPLSSSGFNLFDGDIPLCQLVLHGVIPYTTKAVNSSADAEHMVLRAIAAGSNLRFDLLAADASDLTDTDFDVYFYANADYWTEQAAQYDRFSADILAAVSDSHIISYREDGSRITTKYANGTETVVDLDAYSVSVNGKVRYLKDYVKEGAAVLS